MKITPVKGTNDYLPAQAELRNYLQKKICETYEQAGFRELQLQLSRILRILIRARVEIT